MKENFPYGQFKKIGFFTKEMKGNYEAQAKRVCEFLGYESIYEYRAESFRCHISYEPGHEPQGYNGVHDFKSIYED